MRLSEEELKVRKEIATLRRKLGLSYNDIYEITVKLFGVRKTLSECSIQELYIIRDILAEVEKKLREEKKD